MVQARAWMKLYHLVVLDSQVVTGPFQMCNLEGSQRLKNLIHFEHRRSFRTYLHEETCHQSFSYVEIVVSAREVSAGSFQTEPVHDPRQLSADVVGALERSVVDKIVITPVGIFVVYSINQK